MVGKIGLRNEVTMHILFANALSPLFGRIHQWVKNGLFAAALTGPGGPRALSPPFSTDAQSRLVMGVSSDVKGLTGKIGDLGVEHVWDTAGEEGRSSLAIRKEEKEEEEKEEEEWRMR